MGEERKQNAGENLEKKGDDSLAGLWIVWELLEVVAVLSLSPDGHLDESGGGEEEGRK